VLMLPLEDLFLKHSPSPQAEAEPGALLDNHDWLRLRKLFVAIDADESSTIEKVEIAAVHGAQLMLEMDENDDGRVSTEEWDLFFEVMLLEKGRSYLQWFLSFLERNVSSLEALRKVVNEHFIPAMPPTSFAAASAAGAGLASAPRLVSRSLSGSHRPPSQGVATPPQTHMPRYSPDFSGSPSEQMDRLLLTPPSDFARTRIAEDLPQTLELPEAATVQEDGEAVPDGLSPSEWKRIKELYQEIDTDGDGQLDVWEIRAVHGGDSEGLFMLLDTDGDERVSINEFGNFFSKLRTLRGSIILGIVVSYLEANVKKMNDEEEILTLPLATLLLHETPAPTPCECPQAELTKEQCEKVYGLFERIDINKDGALDKSEILNHYGAGTDSIFSDLDVNGDGGVTIIEWLQFFSHLIQKNGEKSANHTITQLERTSTAISMTQQLIS